jgi:hypothetical protein
LVTRRTSGAASVVVRGHQGRYRSLLALFVGKTALKMHINATNPKQKVPEVVSLAPEAATHETRVPKGSQSDTDLVCADRAIKSVAAWRIERAVGSLARLARLARLAG